MIKDLLVKPSHVPHRAFGVRIRRVNGNLVLAVQDDALLIEGPAMLIYMSVDGRRTVADVAGLVVAEYGIAPEEALSDVTEFLADMTARGIIIWT